MSHHTFSPVPARSPVTRRREQDMLACIVDALLDVGAVPEEADREEWHERLREACRRSRHAVPAVGAPRRAAHHEDGPASTTRLTMVS